MKNGRIDEGDVKKCFRVEGIHTIGQINSKTSCIHTHTHICVQNIIDKK